MLDFFTPHCQQIGNLIHSHDDTRVVDRGDTYEAGDPVLFRVALAGDKLLRGSGLAPTVYEGAAASEPVPDSTTPCSKRRMVFAVLSLTTGRSVGS